MQPAMTERENALFTSILKTSKVFSEFGSGGSTVLATKLVSDHVMSVDSSKEWLSKVAGACEDIKPVILTLFSVDIGPTKEWGWPKDNAFSLRWSTYHESVWNQDERFKNADTYLIDGRFRVACFLQVIERAARSPLIMFHDYACRNYYHLVAEFAEEISVIDNLSVFRKKSRINQNELRASLLKYSSEPQ